jgi:hypothetical protein
VRLVWIHFLLQQGMPVLPNNQVLNNNSTQQQLQDYNINQIHDSAVRSTNGSMKTSILVI